MLNIDTYLAMPHELTNGIKGSILFNDANWFRFCNTELEIEIVLKESIEISCVKVGTLIYLDYWIFGPSKLSVPVSNNKKNYKSIAQKTYPVPKEGIPLKRVDLNVSFRKQNAGYVKIYIGDIRKIPKWHGGKGHPASLLIDEIGIF